MKKNYPLDIVYVKVFVNRKLLDPVRKISFKTGNYFPTITLQGNRERKLDQQKNSILVLYSGLVTSPLPNFFI